MGEGGRSQGGAGIRNRRQRETCVVSMYGGEVQLRAAHSYLHVSVLRNKSRRERGGARKYVIGGASWDFVEYVLW